MQQKAGPARDALSVTTSILVAQRAAARTGVHPVALDEIVLAAKRHVVVGAVARNMSGAEGPRAFVGVLFAGVVEPGVQVRIADRFFQLVRKDRCSRIGACVAVRTRRLSRAGVQATRSITDEGVLDVASVNGAVGVPAAVRGAEA